MSAAAADELDWGTQAKPAETRFEIRDETGALVAIHVRPPDKKMRWEQPDGTPGLNGQPVAELPLYGIDRLESRSVVLVEGEKVAAALVEAGEPAVGTVTGAQGTPNEQALAPLAGRVVFLSPDADDVGHRHMERIALALVGVAARVRWIRPPSEAPKGWDLADAIAERGVDYVRELIESAIDAGEALPSQGEAPTGIDAADLLALDLAPLRWIVPDLVPEGTFTLAAPPKVGKSCLIYQVAVEVAIGGELFGRRVTPGSVLYLALEDGQRRGQARLRAALAGRTMPRGRLEVRWSAPKIGEGLEEMIDGWLAAHPDAALVAIDTLGRVRPRSSGKRNAYDVDVEDLGRLQSLFRDRATALGIVHHSNKAGGDDFLATVSGTYGITGSVDTIVVIKRIRLEQFGTINVTGREVAEAELPVRFDGMLWHEAPQSLPQASFERAEVFRVIEHFGPVFPAAIARRLGLERTSVAHMVDKLVQSGAIVRMPKGYAVVEPARARVSLPDHSTHSESDQSEGGHTRAPAREAPSLQCSAFVAHQAAHRQVRSGEWVCDLCEAKA